ncbi:MAG: nucleotidyltransferase domain-containing protein [archaeon]|nr:nucleotidyltransferase domain-containing protein [archaeon]
MDSSIEEKVREIERHKLNITQRAEEKNDLSLQINELNRRLNTSVEEEHKIFIYKKFESIPNRDDYMIRSLQKDLLDYQKQIKEKISFKRPVIDDLMKKLQEVIDEINTNYKVTLYGSYSTGLCLPWSDMDVVITSKTKGITDDFLLSKIFLSLTKKSWVQSYKFIENTSVPIIKLVSNDEFHFHIDISVENEKHFGLKCVELVKSFLNTYPLLEPLVLALKTILNNGQLNNPYSGGLSSYGLILMVVSFIQSQIDGGKMGQSPTLLGETFLNFLGHYGIYFDYQKYIIMTYPPDRNAAGLFNLPGTDALFQLGPSTHDLIIVDPLNSQNNVARSTFQFMNIKMAFMISYMVAKEDCECGCHYDIAQNKRNEMEHCILKRIFLSVKRFSCPNPQSGF